MRQEAQTFVAVPGAVDADIRKIAGQELAAQSLFQAADAEHAFDRADGFEPQISVYEIKFIYPAGINTAIQT